jgi:hypothetical protein
MRRTHSLLSAHVMYPLCYYLRLIAYMSLLTFTRWRVSVHDMALARARGCAGRGSPPGSHARQADASRRRNGPRKATSRRLITVRLRSKSCPAGRYGVFRTGRRAPVAQSRLRNPQQANVGSKTRSAGRVPPCSITPGPIALGSIRLEGDRDGNHRQGTPHYCPATFP